MMDDDEAREARRTPFVQQQNGEWALFLIKDKGLQWGHRFDAGIGYRVFVKFTDSRCINAFPAMVARQTAYKISKGETNVDILNIGIQLKRMADAVEKLNKEWAAAGAPDQPLHELGESGHA